MLFNSLEFALFLPIVFALYWFVCNKNLQLQNAFLLVVSYFFYGWWDWRFLSLIIFSSFVDFFVGKQLGKEEEKGKRKIYLWISILINLGFLGFFKYFNFFAESFADAFTLLGMPFEVNRLSIILPVGISFYTFQTLSYTIDVYKKHLKPSNDIIAFFAFVSFFPQLVAGPIERATNLLPQFLKKRAFDYLKAKDGLRQILWGLFKKVVIADNCARIVDAIFSDPNAYGGSTLFIGAFLFTFQIYCDFSGYSDIAIGTARLFGFNLMQNFAFPYFSRDIAEFWRRWHISLSTWFRDYLYIPLGGSRGGTAMKIRNTFAIFLVSGFWHGANWTFIFWGALNAFYFLPLLLTNRNRNNIGVVAEERLLPSLRNGLNMFATFILAVLAWVFFRSDNLTLAFEYIGGIFSVSLFSVPTILPFLTLALIAFLCLIEWLGRAQQHALEVFLLKWPRLLRWTFYLFLILTVVQLGQKEQSFIYFQF